MRHDIRHFTVGFREMECVATTRSNSISIGTHVDSLLEKVPDRIKNTLTRTIFHNADADENGVIDIDEFFNMFETIEDE